MALALVPTVRAVRERLLAVTVLSYGRIISANAVRLIL